MNQILILTQRNDLHAACVAAALQQAGHNFSLLRGAEVPSLCTATVRIDSMRGSRISFSSQEGGSIEDSFDVVWNRRRRNPMLAEGILHPSDESFARAEWASFGNALWPFLAQSGLWINSIKAQEAASSKLLQLSVAIGLGHKVPNTLVTNDPQEIRDFLHRHPRAIYKPFRGIGEWIDGRSVAYETTRIDINDLPSDTVQKNTIGIFQDYVEKSFEVRILIFGPYCFSLKINSSAMKNPFVDWRNYRLGTVDMEATEVPDSVYAFCKKFMDKLDLKFGAFDFIVNHDHEWVFLEVNESGQFLFMEMADKSLNILSAFCHFLSDPYAAGKEIEHHPSYADIIENEKYKEFM